MYTAWMKKAYLTNIGRIELFDEPVPAIDGEGDVLIRVHSVGVCGSDLHYFRHGRIGQQIVKFPWAVGHECSGVIEAASAACSLKPGTRVAVDPLVPCLLCDQCQFGREHTCRNQKFLGVPGQLDGAMSQYLVLPARCCLPIPDNMTFDQAVMTEPLAIALWAVTLAGTLEDKKVGILGAGPIGLSVLESLKLHSPAHIAITDLLEERVDLAQKRGADWVGNASLDSTAGKLESMHPLGIDVVFECAGKNETIDQAVRLLAPGGKLVLVGIPEGDRVSFDMNYLRRKELQVQNVRRQNGCTAKAIDLVATGKVDVDSMITHHFQLKRSQEAFDLVANYRDGVVKAMIHMWD